MIHNRLQQPLKRIIITRVLALADQSKIGCITQPRFAKAGTETPPQRGAALDRNGLSVSTETACRFEPKSPAGNSEICTGRHLSGGNSLRRVGLAPDDRCNVTALPSCGHTLACACLLG